MRLIVRRRCRRCGHWYLLQSSSSSVAWGKLHWRPIVFFWMRVDPVTLLVSGEDQGAESTARGVLALFWGKIGALVAYAISQWFNVGDSSDFETLRFHDCV